MSVQTFGVSDVVNVTPAAAQHFLEQLTKKGAKAIRISLKESGCTGYMYVIDEVETAALNDLKMVLNNGVELFVDPSHLTALQGTVVDYVKQGLNQNLVMQNPNVKAACGCGESFSV